MAQSPPISASKQETLDEGLQFEQKMTSSDPVPKPITSASSISDSDEEGEIFKKNPFLDPDVAEHWVAVYENSRYECRSAFDPTFTWSEEEERKLVRRLDWRVCFWACIMFFGLQVDRGNLVQAVSDNMLNDLNLTTNGKPSSTKTRMYPNKNNRLQLRKYYILLLLFVSGAPVSTCFEEDWSRSMDPYANHSLVDCSHVPMCH